MISPEASRASEISFGASLYSSTVRRGAFTKTPTFSVVSRLRTLLELISALESGAATWSPRNSGSITCTFGLSTWK